MDFGGDASSSSKNVFAFGQVSATAGHSLRVEAEGDTKVEDLEAGCDGDENNDDGSAGNKAKKHRLSVENERYVLKSRLIGPINLFKSRFTGV